MYEELADEGFVPIAVALDRCADDARPFIEASASTHPSPIDTEHRLAELYHITNVPTMLWIDEQGRICRPHDSQFGTDTFAAVTHKRFEPYLEMIRRWLRTGEGALTTNEALAPLDWTIRRGSMPIVGSNPFGPEFFELAAEGKPEYALEALTPTHDPELAAASEDAS